MENENESGEIMTNGDAVGLAMIGLVLTVLAMLYTGCNAARILTIRGEIFSRTLVNETITRSFKVQHRKAPTAYYQCFLNQEREQCLSVGTTGADKKAGEPLETIRIWDGNSYYIHSPYLEDMNMYFVGFIVCAVICLLCLLKIMFPRFQILQSFNDTRTTKLFD